jgi:hypothetical protein
MANFLDQQAMVFMRTADMLARMSRENLVQARLVFELVLIIQF